MNPDDYSSLLDAAKAFDTGSTYGQVSGTCPEKQRETWVEIRVVDMDKQPVPNLRYKLRVPDGRLLEGSLNDKGMVRVDGLRKGGSCEVSFPDLDTDTWEKFAAGA